MASLPHAGEELEAALNLWLASECGVAEPRRIVRADRERILVSKVAPGFTLDLYKLVQLMPELFDEVRAIEACELRARSADAHTPRSENWRAAMHEMLAEAGRHNAIEPHRLAEVRTAIDSVFAVLDAVLWSRRTLAQAARPEPGEIDAYRDGAARLAPGGELFRRYYGQFEGRAVENHCPGAALARSMLAHAWRACTGTPPPVD